MASTEPTIEEGEALEVNFNIDAVEPTELVTPVEFAPAAFAMLEDEEELEINNRVDWAEAAAVIEPMTFDETEFALIFDDEELEINNRVDWAEAAAVVEPMTFDETEFALNIDDEELEINSHADGVEAAAVVEQVTFEEQTFAMNMDDEELVISETIDGVVPEPVPEVIAFNEAPSIDVVADEELEITIESQPAATLAIVEPVFSDEPEFELMADDIEISHTIDAVAPVSLVQQVVVDENRSEMIIEDDALEINTTMDVSVAKSIDPVPYGTHTDLAELNEEQLEINFFSDMAKKIKLVERIDIAQTDTEVMPEEHLEIRMDVDRVEPAQQVESVQFVYTEIDIETMPEELELHIEDTGTVPVPQIAAVEMPSDNYAGTALAEESLELRYDVDAVEVAPQVEQVAYSRFSSRLDELEELLEISFTIDAAKQENLTADNSDLTSDDLAGIEEMPPPGSELFYLREFVSGATNIETSYTDMDIVRMALLNPDDLSYEELLYAASIAPVPEDKLKIYNYAFVHIDRDWRAFNNAGITAINILDLAQAEVYLYQASLISKKNGKVENNMGVLACYKSDFTTAENHFLTACRLGVNSEYNLQLVKHMVSSSNRSTY